jgi:hypothetical protein
MKWVIIISAVVIAFLFIALGGAPRAKSKTAARERLFSKVDITIKTVCPTTRSCRSQDGR